MYALSCVYVFVVDLGLYLESKNFMIWYMIISRLPWKEQDCLHVRLNVLELMQWCIYSVKK